MNVYYSISNPIITAHCDNLDKASSQQSAFQSEVHWLYVSFDDFFLAQGEKSRRSNIDEDNYQRKATRYNSRSVLSGLLVCAECGHNYRRITRPSGEIVWRCANRVEHGKKSCQHSPSISEDRIKDVLCEKLGLSTFDGDEIKNKVDVILVQSDGSLQIELQCVEYFEMLPN